MNDTKYDVLLGGLLVNPVKVFGMTTEPILKGWKRELYNFCREEFLLTGTAGLDKIYAKLREKDRSFKVLWLFNLMDAYSDYRWRKIKDSMYYGNPYCSWPLELNWEQYKLLLEKFGEEKLQKWFEQWAEEDLRFWEKIGWK